MMRVPVPAAVDPRVERTRRVVLDATIELIIEGGFSAVTIEAVAARSGVAKSTIYRHWPDRVELMHDAFHELKPSVRVPTEGPIRERIIIMLEDFARNLGSSTWSLCLPTLIEAAERDPEAAQLHRRLAGDGRQVLVDLLVEGLESGEFSFELDPVIMAEAVAGPILLRRLMSPAPFDPADVPLIVDQLLPPVRQPSSVG
jgi:TetR/AcrR family transcriptional regulator, regulator of autoinduction and epiphytic fitness